MGGFTVLRKNLKGFIVGVMFSVLMVSSFGVVFARTGTETINVIYDNIRILIDGVEFTPRDGNGNVVHPFIYNGTTYLPVRAVANAFGKDVS
jgi:hypothetical protein